MCLSIIDIYIRIYIYIIKQCIYTIPASLLSTFIVCVTHFSPTTAAASFVAYHPRTALQNKPAIEEKAGLYLVCE